MAVGKMMHHLPGGPSALAVRRIELRGIHAADRGAKFRRRFGDFIDPLPPLAGRYFPRERKFPDRIPGIGCHDFPGPCIEVDTASSKFRAPPEAADACRSRAVGFCASPECGPRAGWSKAGAR